MGDFYTYLTFIGIVSVWSIYGLITTVMKSASGITVYMVGLIFITVIHFIIGFIHIMLLFTTYRPILLDSCLQRQPTRLFWWSLGYDDNEEIKKIYMACSTQWISFATERFVSWIVYSFISFLCLYFVVRYQRYITHQRNKAQGVVTGATDGDWSDDGDDYSTFVEKKKQDGSTDKVTYYHEEFPTTKSEDSELSANMHQQRQKLFDVIAKRKRARSSLNRRPTIGNPSEETVNVVHPLDLAQDLDDYEPPPMPPAEDTSESWNRYNDELLKEEQEALERQKRVDSLSTERLEYEMYRSHGSKSRESSISETVRQDASRRK
ncbi:uncharacterized protein EV154DRAFT_406531, partial [Mucor mucedo]|uniref:uncharacterized protein n=1 Tax=Mucor mucedo TaxID=29922 RepID=UPI00221F4DB0